MSENKYSIKIEDRPDEDFKRYYPQYWGYYIGPGGKPVYEWRSYEGYQNANKLLSTIFFDNELDARSYIQQKKEKEGIKTERILID